MFCKTTRLQANKLGNKEFDSKWIKVKLYSMILFFDEMCKTAFNSESTVYGDSLR